MDISQIHERLYIGGLPWNNRTSIKSREAFRYVLRKRTPEDLNWPASSHFRYVQYFNNILLLKGNLPNPFPLKIHSVVLTSIPHFDINGLCSPGIEIYESGSMIYSSYFSTQNRDIKMNIQTETIVFKIATRPNREPLHVSSDIQIRIVHCQDNQLDPSQFITMLWFSFNTGFMSSGLIRVSPRDLDLKKEDLDNGKFDDGLGMDIIFSDFKADLDVDLRAQSYSKYLDKSLSKCLVRLVNHHIIRIDQRDVEKLLGSGCSKEIACFALQRSNNNIKVALEYIQKLIKSHAKPASSEKSSKSPEYTPPSNVPPRKSSLTTSELSDPTPPPESERRGSGGGSTRRGQTNSTVSSTSSSSFTSMQKSGDLLGSKQQDKGTIKRLESMLSIGSSSVGYNYSTRTSAEIGNVSPKMSFQNLQTTRRPGERDRSRSRGMSPSRSTSGLASKSDALGSLMTELDFAISNNDSEGDNFVSSPISNSYTNSLYFPPPPPQKERNNALDKLILQLGEEKDRPIDYGQVRTNAMDGMLGELMSFQKTKEEKKQSGNDRGTRGGGASSKGKGGSIDLLLGEILNSSLFEEDVLEDDYLDSSTNKYNNESGTSSATSSSFTLSPATRRFEAEVSTPTVVSQKTGNTMLTEEMATLPGLNIPVPPPPQSGERREYRKSTLAESPISPNGQVRNRLNYIDTKAAGKRKDRPLTVFLQAGEKAGVERKEVESALNVKNFEDMLTVPVDKTKAKYTHLIDLRRANNISIVLSSYSRRGIKPRALVSAIRDLDSSILSLDDLLSIKAILPTCQEKAIVLSFRDKKRANPKEYAAKPPLAPAECFLLDVARQLDIEEMCLAFHFKLALPIEQTELLMQCEQIKKVCLGISGSEKFKILLRTVYQLGGLSNQQYEAVEGGNVNPSYKPWMGKEARALGFRIDGLARLKEIKSADGKWSLMSFFVNMVQTNSPEVLSVTQDFTELKVVKNFDTQILVRQLMLLETTLESLKSFTFDDEEFAEIITPFLFSATHILQQLRTAYLELDKIFVETATYLGEDISQYHSLLDIPFTIPDPSLDQAAMLNKKHPVHLFYTLDLFFEAFDQAVFENWKLKDAEWTEKNRQYEEHQKLLKKQN